MQVFHWLKWVEDVNLVLHPQAMNTTLLSPENRLPDQRKLALPILEGWLFEPIENVRYLEAQGSYTLLHLQKGPSILVSRNLAALEVQIDDPIAFVRIHRSFVLHLAFLRRYIKTKSPTLVLDDGTSLPLSLTRKSAFVEALQHFFRF